MVNIQLVKYCNKPYWSIIFLSIVPAFFFFGCNSEIIYDDTLVVDGNVEINAILVNGKQVYVELNLATDQIVGEIDNSVPNADVFLYEDESLIRQLSLDSVAIEAVLEPFVNYTPYISDSIISLKQGSYYHIEVVIDDLVVAQTAKLRYTPILHIDSIAAPLANSIATERIFPEVLEFNIVGEVIGEKNGDLEVSVLPVSSDDVSDYKPTIIDISTGFYVNFINPSPGIFSNKFEYRNLSLSNSDKISQSNDLLIYRIQFIPEELTSLRSYIFQSSGLEEDFGSGIANLEPPSTNSPTGYGSFFIIEAYEFQYNL